MITFFLRVLCVFLLALSSGYSQNPGGLDAHQAVGAYFNGVFPAATPSVATTWTAGDAFPNLRFVDPLCLREIPTTKEFLLVGKDGQIWRFANNSSVTQSQVVQVLDWRSKTQVSEDQGFYSLVFHPQFGQAGSPNANYVYVCYSHMPDLAGAGPNFSYWRVSRFTWIPATGTLDPASEFVFINQFDADLWHNGGATYFDNQGFLNITNGDGGDSPASGGLSGALANTQRITFGLFSGVLRIDVDNDPAKSHPIRRQPRNHANKPANWPASSTEGYGIPNDNPWLDPAGGVLEEFNCFGLRSPHTAHYDPSAGEAWIGDVGENAREEMTRLGKGMNAQWGTREGTVTGPGNAYAGFGTPRVPTYDYDRSMGGCIIGGMQYRGEKWAELLGGKVIFGDHLTGRVWAMKVTGVNQLGTENIVSGLPVARKVGLGNFWTDSAGEIYLMIVGPNGSIWKLDRGNPPPEPPPLLSQTGIFTDLATLGTASGVIPYDVQSPLWSDGAEKKRWLILPNDGVHNTDAERIVFSDNGNWSFPAGTVFVKHFEMPVDERDPSVVKRLETRVIVCTTGGRKYGVTYRWNEAGTDAQLMTEGGSLDFDEILQNGTTRTRRWDFPSRSDCMRCHTDVAGQALGLRTHQLNREFQYPATGRVANQLGTFNALGMFSTSLSVTDLKNYLQASPLENTAVPLEHRVRSYLDANCSHCHQPYGPVDSFDARLGTPLNLQGMIDGMLRGHFSLGPDGRYLKPGNPALSAVYVRTAAAGNGTAMPPLGKSIVHDQAVAVLRDYLEQLDPAEIPANPPISGRYVRLSILSRHPSPTQPRPAVAEFSILDSVGAIIPPSELSITGFSSENSTSKAIYAIDGDPSSFWRPSSSSFPSYITVDLGRERIVSGVLHMPLSGGAGEAANYEVHMSSNGSNWTSAKAGTFPNNPQTTAVDLNAGVRAARCEIAAPSSTDSGMFETTIVFDMAVTDFSAQDLTIQGGKVVGFRGRGYYYVATIRGTAPNVKVSVGRNAVSSIRAGSLASNEVTVAVRDIVPPRPQFIDVPQTVAESFRIGLVFGEPVTGLTPGDFTISNGTLMGISAAEDGYVLAITPIQPGMVGIQLHAAAVADEGSIPTTDGIHTTVFYQPYTPWDLEAENMDLSDGFITGEDVVASGGRYIGIPQGSRNGVCTLDESIKATYRIKVPKSGEYSISGIVRPFNGAGGSFYLGLDGISSTARVLRPYSGSFYFQEGQTGNWVLSAGSHTLEVYARDEGAQLDMLRVSPVGSLPTWSGPSMTEAAPFTVGLTFSRSIIAVGPSMIVINGGVVQSVSKVNALGYTVTIVPQSSLVSLYLPENTAGSHLASETFTIFIRTRFEKWAFDHNVDVSPLSRLADEDKDGLPKVLEYAFNLDPAKGDHRMMDPVASPAAGLPRLADSSSGAALQFLRRKGVPGLTYVPQFGSTLGDFENATAPLQVESINAEWERVTVQDTAAPANSSKRFGRVKVIMTP